MCNNLFLVLNILKINTNSVSNSLIESKSIKDRILLEEIPSGREFLVPIIDAMKENRFIYITHYNYWREDTQNYYVMLLCVKLFKQRWYLVGRCGDQIMTLYSLLTVCAIFVFQAIDLNIPWILIPQNTLKGV